MLAGGLHNLDGKVAKAGRLHVRNIPDIAPEHAKALAFGDPNDPESAFSVEKQRCIDKHYNVVEMPKYAQKKAGVFYAMKM